ncbi:unnamed protein product [Mycena citricolor]|uniref:Uncharacterized protein n=1 Tax=Mycena citricolor TaxID=2018698 RepID=A0AAD2Q6Z0_9AGAR|nr:unnamed protein product [Mycena citricolor]
MSSQISHLTELLPILIPDYERLIVTSFTHDPMSRSTRIKILLAIDVVFFFVELISGYAVGSLALVADSFHMLNDVMSLIVALYAIKLTEENESDSRYSYGWHRAEILAALVNGVFLLALCFSIFLEALERFFSTPEISNPQLVVIVGTLGLASNIVGLFLFMVRGWLHLIYRSKFLSRTLTRAFAFAWRYQVQWFSANSRIFCQLHYRQTWAGVRRIGLCTRWPSCHDARGHRARFEFLVDAVIAYLNRDSVAQDMARQRSPSPPRSHVRTMSLEGPRSRSHSLSHGPSENTPLLGSAHDEQAHEQHTHGHEHGHDHGHGHSHSHAGSMNMRALVLHVLGDALGNVGVIATGLIIWRTNWQFKYYFDPVISLVIAIIIFSSSLPLGATIGTPADQHYSLHGTVRSAAFVLLQGVPSTVSLEEVREAILAVPGVLGLHELHIWQLSESKNIASVHVLVSTKVDFMPIAAHIRMTLHHHGIHSCTIQPEYNPTGPSEHVVKASPCEIFLTCAAVDEPQSSEDTSCLVQCPPDQACNPQDNACCPPPPAVV